MATAMQAAIEPDEWAEEFTEWLNARCVATKRFNTSLTVLYRDFAGWCETRNDWPCEPAAFGELMRQAGFRLINTRNVLLVGPIGLLEDVEFIRELYNKKSGTTIGRGLWSDTR